MHFDGGDISDLTCISNWFSDIHICFLVSILAPRGLTDCRGTACCVRVSVLLFFSWQGGFPTTPHHVSTAQLLASSVPATLPSFPKQPRREATVRPITPDFSQSEGGLHTFGLNLPERHTYHIPTYCLHLSWAGLGIASRFTLWFMQRPWRLG